MQPDYFDHKVHKPCRVSIPTTSPGPCKTCGTYGYRDGIPPSYRKSFWTRTAAAIAADDLPDMIQDDPEDRPDVDIIGDQESDSSPDPES